jgi:hypothetical protein
MASFPSPGWALRLVDVLGAQLEEVEEEHLARLVDGAVREDADVDFKQERYGNSDSEKRELAGDIAAMANDRGGLIVVGVRDENDVAVELTPVELVDGEEARIRQIAAGNIAPHVAFAVRVVHAHADPATGYYLLIVPPSTVRPHAVRQDRNLRYPRRDGTTTRWLSEAEVADAYRDRFSVATSQTARVESVMEEGLGAMDLTEHAFVAVALVPTSAGSMSIDARRVAAVENWAKDLGAPNFFDGFFLASPAAGVRAHRVALTTIYERDQPPRSQYAELYDDGAGFACFQLTDPRDPRHEYTEIWVLDERLLWLLGCCLHLLGRHAVQNCGGWGDALVEARVIGKDMQLAYILQMGPAALPRAVEPTRTINEAVSRHSVVVEAIARVGQALSAATRLVAMDLFHAFGSPEVRQITAQGALRYRSLGGNGELRRWAEDRGIDLSE